MNAVDSRGTIRRTICKNCGKEFEYDLKANNNRERQYCCRSCASVDRWAKRKCENRTKCNSTTEEKQNRPLTADTAYYVRLWHAKGDSPEEIAGTLNRSVEQVTALLKERESK